MWYFTETLTPMIVELGDDKRAAVPVTRVHGPFDCVDALQTNLSERVKQAKGNGTAFHVYNKPEEIPMPFPSLAATVGKDRHAKVKR